MKIEKVEKIEINEKLYNTYKSQTIIKRRKKSEGYEYVCAATDADSD